MRQYTLRKTWPDQPEREDDYEFRCDGKDVGRCYLRRLSSNRHRWWWTVYIGEFVKGSVQGFTVQGDAATLEEAKAQFQKNFEAMVAAGVVTLGEVTPSGHSPALEASDRSHDPESR